MERVLITGGAGFIGRQVTKLLLSKGYRVRILDTLIEQVHQGARPADLPRDAELVIADVRDQSAVERALDGVHSVIHLAAEVGVGQSMYAVERYVSVNDLGTAVLFQSLINRNLRRVGGARALFADRRQARRPGALHADAGRHHGRERVGGEDHSVGRGGARCRCGDRCSRSERERCVCS